MNTHATYSSGQRSYLSYCEQVRSPPFPITEHKLCSWIADLATRITPKAIRVYMYAIRSLSVDGGAAISFKDMHQLARVYNGIKKHHGISSTRPRLPITLGVLHSMYIYLDMNVHDDIILWAAFTLAVSNMLRVSEFAITRYDQYPAPITHADLNINKSSQYYQLHIKKSKTDQYAEGRTVHVFATGAITCPVDAMRRLMCLFSTNRPRPQAAVFQLRSGVPLSTCGGTSFEIFGS